MAQTNNKSSRCYIGHDSAWIHYRTNAGRADLHYTSPYKVVAYTPEGRMVPLCLEDPSEMKPATAYVGKKKFEGVLDKRGEDEVTLIKRDGCYTQVKYDALELSGNPNTTIVKWVCDAPVELKYKTTGVKWTNITEINACTDGPSTITDTALIDSDLPYRYEGEVTLIKSEKKSERNENGPSYMSLTESTSSIQRSSESSKVAHNPEVHKCLGWIALPSLMKVELNSSPFEYQMVYNVELNGAPKKDSATIQLESRAPWYILPSKCNLQYGNYHRCYHMPSTPKGERISFPVSKSPDVHYSTSLNYNKTKEGESWKYDVTIEVTVEDTAGTRDKSFIFALKLGQYQLVSVKPAPTEGLQQPGWIHWKASCEGDVFSAVFNLSLLSNSSYFNL